MNLLERMVFEPQGGMFREFEGLTAHFEPKDVALYRRLLPEQFAMPLRPIVTIFLGMVCITQDRMERRSGLVFRNNARYQLGSNGWGTIPRIPEICR